MCTHLFAWQATSAQSTTRLFVEPFITKSSAEQLRQDLIGELRKISSISVVSDPSSVNAILGGALST